MQMIGVFAEFERGVIRERTKAGLAAKKAQGVKLGRPKKLDVGQRREIGEAVLSRRKTGGEMARLFRVDQSTISRIVADQRRLHEAAGEAAKEIAGPGKPEQPAAKSP